MRLINIGFSNMVSAGRIIAIVSPESAPIKRIIQEAREGGVLIDATCGRRTRAVIITDSDHVVLSAIQPETVAQKGLLLVLSGPSGSGKGTVVRALHEKRADVFLSVSATTRLPRDGEIDGKHYHFYTNERFEAMIAAGEVLEHACYCGNYYGTPKAPVQERLDAGVHVLLEIEVQGAMQVREIMPEAQLVFLLPPSMEELERRLTERGTETQAVIEGRLQRAREELAFQTAYDHTVVNDKVEQAVSELCAILDEEIAERREIL